MEPLWSHSLHAAVRCLALARETNSLLALDAQGRITLLDSGGSPTALRHAPPSPILVADIAEDGSVLVVGDERGTLALLGSDLQVRWERPIHGQPLAVAIEPFGGLIALASTSNHLTLYDGRGQLLWRLETSRALRYLSFVPELALLVGCADFGLVQAFDPAGRTVWREGLVAHVGGLAVTGTGWSTLACFSSGLLCFAADGTRTLGTCPTPCHLVDLSYDGKVLLTVGSGSEVSVWREEGGAKTWSGFAPPTAVALDPLGRGAAVGLADGRIVALETGWSAR